MSPLDIDGRVLTAASPDYAAAIDRRSHMAILNPKLVAFPTSFQDVAKAVIYARDNTLPLAVKGGGAHTATVATAEAGLVIDLAELNSVSLSPDKSILYAQGGCVLGDLYDQVAKHDLVIVGGAVWFVGLGGYMTSGGYSYLNGQKGMAVDNLVGATVVIATGEIVHASESERPDLFWAIRGGLNQFGVVVEFEIKTHPAGGPSTVGAIAYPGTELPKVLEALHGFLKTRTTKESMILAFARAPPHFFPGVLIMPWVEGDEQRGKQVLEPFRTTATPVADMTAVVPNFAAVSHGADAFLQYAPKRVTFGTALYTDLWDDVVTDVFLKWMQFTEQNEDCKESMVMWEFQSSDKAASYPTDATAFPARDRHFYVVLQGRHHKPESDELSKKWVADTTAYIRSQQASKGGKDLGVMVGSAQGHEKPEDLFGPNLPKLRKIKAKYDPNLVFNTGFIIQPDSE